KIPKVIYKYMKCIGLNLFYPQIPNFFNSEQKKMLISGYLNSNRSIIVQCGIKRCLKEKICVYTSSKGNKRKNNQSYAKQFAKEMFSILENNGVSANLKHEELRSTLTIFKKYIPKLVERFNISKSHILYRAKLIKLCEKYPHIIRTLNFQNLNSYKLNILAIVFSLFYTENKTEVEFTKLEDELNMSNNEIRKYLYELQNNGLVHFSKNDINKDFIRPSITGFLMVQNKITNKIKSLNNILTQQGMLHFRCMNCYTINEYLNIVNEDRNFVCPICGGNEFLEYSAKEIKKSYSKQMSNLNRFNNSLDIFPNFYFS
ncbi:MAG: hypothetical protein ACTSRG_13365, partial [Candidatus Helarchaeota archaeon]